MENPKNLSYKQPQRNHSSIKVQSNVLEFNMLFKKTSTFISHVVVKVIKVRTCDATVQNNPNFWNSVKLYNITPLTIALVKLTVFLLWVA